MSRLCIAMLAGAALLFGEGFTFTLGSPVAAQDFQFKAAAFVFRTEGCAEPEKPQLAGTAEGVVAGARRSMALKVVNTAKPGVYAVLQTWPAEGKWVVNLKGTCGSQSAGALVAMSPKGFVRESAKFYPRPATADEIEASLKALSEGGKQ
jgi:hypothetical protein